MQLALDKTNHDLIKKVGGGIERVEEGRFVVQQVECKLRTALGEWVLDERVGFLSIKDMDKNFNLFDLEARAAEIIIGVNGVLSISSIEATYSNRKLLIQFKAKTNYGVIDKTIPWGFN